MSQNRAVENAMIDAVTDTLGWRAMIRRPTSVLRGDVPRRSILLQCVGREKCCTEESNFLPIVIATAIFHYVNSSLKSIRLMEN